MTITEARRVVLLSCDPGVGWGGTKGASVHLSEVAAALAASGVSVFVAAARVDDRAAPAGVSVLPLPGPPRGSPVAARMAADGDRARWLAGLLGELRADALYERFSLHTQAGSRAAAAVGVPHLVELNAPLPVEAATFRRLDEPDAAAHLEGAVLAAATCVLAVSRPVAAYAVDRGARRVVVVPNAVDPLRFSPPTDAGVEPPTAVFLGTLRPWHGIDVVAEAWRILGDDAPRLVIVGDGPRREQLEHVASELTGAVAHAAVPERLAGCQIGLAPYPAVGPGYFSPLKLFEYLAAGLATVAADLPGVTDIVDDTTGIVVPAGDPDALAAAVHELATDPARRHALGQAGRALVQCQHTWAHRAATILQLAGLTHPQPRPLGAAS